MEIKELLEQLEKEILEEISSYEFKEDIKLVFKKKKRELGLLPKYPTLREYINDNSAGAYVRFRFYIPNSTPAILVETCSCSDFALYYNTKILDAFEVADSSEVSSRDSELSIYSLELKRKDDEE